MWRMIFNFGPDSFAPPFARAAPESSLSRQDFVGTRLVRRKLKQPPWLESTVPSQGSAFIKRCGGLEIAARHSFHYQSDTRNTLSMELTAAKTKGSKRNISLVQQHHTVGALRSA